MEIDAIGDVSLDLDYKGFRNILYFLTFLGIF